MVLIGPININNRYGYLGDDGNFIIKPIYDELGTCSEGVISYRVGNTVGFLNADGSIRIKACYDNYEESMPIFKNGLAAVLKNGLFGYIDKNGKWIVSPSHHFAWNYLDEMALVENVHGYYVINAQGNVIAQLDVWDIRRQEDWVKDWNCVRCLFAMEEKPDALREGCVNWRGQIVFPAVHFRITDFCGDIAGFSDEEDSVGSMWGMLNKNNVTLKTPQYLHMESFSEGMAVAARDVSSTGWIDYYGYINTLGEWVIPPKYQQAYAFQNGVARVRVGGFIDHNGMECGEQKYGYINKRGEYIVEPIYTSALDFAHNYAIVKSNNHTTIIDISGKTIWSE